MPGAAEFERVSVYGVTDDLTTGAIFCSIPISGWAVCSLWPTLLAADTAPREPAGCRKPPHLPGKGEAVHLPVPRRRRQPDGYVRIQAGAREATPASRSRSPGARSARSPRSRPRRIASFPPVASFASTARSGRWMSDLLPHLGTHVDDLAFIHGIKVDNNNHGPAVYHTLTGNMFPGSASVGAWVTYGLGQREPGSARLHRAGRPARRHHRRRRRLGERLSAGRLSGHAVPQRRDADRRPATRAPA